MPRRTNPKHVTRIALQLTPDELDIVCASIDSHIYWELSDRSYRNNGYVEPPGADDDETAAEITEAERLLERLRGQVEPAH
jgi:hypothetical protein